MAMELAALGVKIVKAILEVKKIADEVKENVAQAKRVASYMDAFLEVQGKMTQGSSTVSREVLREVEATVNDAMDVLSSFAPLQDPDEGWLDRGKRMVGRLRHRDDDGAAFRRVFGGCQSALQLLGAGQQTDNEERRRADHAAARADQEEAQRVLEQLVSTVETQGQLQALALGDVQRQGQQHGGELVLIKSLLVRLVDDTRRARREDAPPPSPPAQARPVREIPVRELAILEDLPDLGSGAFSRVRRAELGLSAAPVAVKQLNQTPGLDLSAVFDREVRVQAMANHPHVLGLLGVVREGGRLWIVTPLAGGGSLEAMIHGEGAAAEALGPRGRVQLALGLVEGLRYLHEELKVAHHDLKPANVLIGADGAPLVCDFGLSRVRERSTAGSSSAAAAQAGGTLRYAAPDERRGFAGDVYSLGMVLYELVAGQRPYGRMPDFQIVRAVMTGKTPPFPEGVPEVWRELMRAMWAPEPAQRLGLQEVGQRLLDMLQELRPSHESHVTPSPELQRRLDAYGGELALHKAAAAGDAEAVGALAGAGAAVDLQDKNGWTALMRAAGNGHAEAVGALVGAGAAVDLQNKNGTTALMLAACMGHAEAVGALAGAGAAVDLQDKDGWTALMLAARFGHAEAVGALVGAGAAVDLQDKDGWTALMLAARFGHAEAVGALAGAGAAVDLQNKNGWTALMLAARFGHAEAVGALVGAGAAVDLQGKNGSTARSLALHGGHTAVVALLDG